MAGDAGGIGGQGPVHALQIMTFDLISHHSFISSFVEYSSTCTAGGMRWWEAMLAALEDRGHGVC